MSAIALLIMAAQPATQADQFAFDVRCMVATQMLATQKGEIAMAAQMAAMFYFGRVDAFLTTPGFEGRMKAEVKKLEGQPMGPILKECGEFMQARGKAMQAVGVNLKAQAAPSDIQ